MKVSVKRSKTMVGNFIFGDVFCDSGNYYLVTSHPAEDKELFCVNIETGEGRYFDMYEKVEIVNGEFAIGE